MAETTARRKAVKLKVPVTRDSFYSWTLNHQAYCCQEPSWRQFCPGMAGISTLDGGEDGLYCLPPTATDVQLWSLLENYQWDPLPMEQLLNIPEQIPSRQVTPDSTPPQLRQEEQYQGHQVDDLQLELLPGQQLQPGRVHVLPHLQQQDHQVNNDLFHHELAQAERQPIFFTPLEGYPVDMEKYRSRVTEIAAGLRGFSPSQDYERYCRANWVARTEQYTKHHSAYTRLKNVFKKH